MLTEKQIRSIKIMNTTLSTPLINRFDEEWSSTVDRILKSGKDLSKIQIVQEDE